MSDRKYVFGFSNVDEINPFTIKVRESLEAVAAERSDVELIIRDNNLDTERAIRNAQDFANADVDVAIIFHIDERAGQDVVKPLRDKNIPIISVDIPIARTVYFGLNNQTVGGEAGDVLADWIRQHWNGKIQKTLVMTEYRVLDIFRQRLEYAVYKLEEKIPTFSRENLLYLDNGGNAEITSERVQSVLNRWHDIDHIAIVCMNDNVAIGVLDAIEKTERYDDIALLSHDGTHVAVKEFESNKSSLIVSTHLDANEYGHGLIDLCIRMANGEKVDAYNYVHTVPMTRENFREFHD